MTKLKIKEKINFSTDTPEIYANCLESGDMLYSYEYDILLLVMENENSDFFLFNLTDSKILNDDGFDYFNEVFEHYNKRFGPFYPVTKAKITFKVGD